MFKKILWGLMFVFLVGFVSADIIKLNEVSYEPTFTADFIEIYSDNDALDLTGWKISDTQEDTLEFLKSNSASNYYVIIPKESTLDISRGHVYTVDDTRIGNGITGTDVVTLKDAADVVIDVIDLNTANTGAENSYERQDIAQDVWLTSLLKDGTPGSLNTVSDNEDPVANLSVDQTSINEGETVAFNGNDSTDNLGIVRAELDFGDNEEITINADAGEVITVIEQEHTYQQQGTYEVNLTVFDVNGNRNSTYETINVADIEPVAAYTNTNPIEDQEVNFTDASTSYDGVTYRWDINGTIVYTTRNISHIFTLNGTYEVNLTVTEADGNISIVSKQIEVAFVNDLPVYQALGDKSFDEDTSIVVPLIASDEEDGTDLLHSCISENANLISIYNETNKEINLTPALNWNGTSVITCTVTDSAGATAVENFTATVNEVNDAPTINTITDLVAYEEVEYTSQIVASDVESDNMTYYSLSPANLEVNETTGAISLTPTTAQALIGEVEIKFRVDDERGESTEYAYNVTVHPALEFLNLKVDGEVVVGEIEIAPGQDFGVTFDVMNNYFDRLSGITITGTALGQTRTLTQTGQDAGNLIPVSFDFEVDNTNLPDDFTLELRVEAVNQTGDKTFISEEEVNFTITRSIHNIIIDSLEFEKPELTCSKANELIVNLSNLGSFDETDVKVRIYTADESINLTQTTTVDSNELKSVPFTINAENITANAEFNVQVTYFNDDNQVSGVVTLQIGSCFDRTGIEAALQIPEDFENETLINLTDYTNNITAVTFATTMDDTSLISCTTTDGVLTCEAPTADQTGQALVNLTITAGSTIVEETFYVTVTGANDAPVWTQTLVIGDVVEDSGINSSYNLTEYVSDTENDALTFSALSLNESELICDVSGEFLTFRPVDNWFGTGLCNVTVSDGSASATQTVSVTITSVNDVPQITVITDQSAVIGELFELQVVATDVEDNSVDYLLVGEPTGMQISTSGNITWTPTIVGTYPVIVNVTDSENASTEISFNVVVSDGLQIQNVMIDVGDTTPQLVLGNVQVLPSQSIDLTFDLVNNFDNITIENIFINGTNEALGLFDEEDVQSIASSSQNSINLILGSVSATAADGTYALVIVVRGTDDNDNVYFITETINLEVDRNNHQLSIADTRISQPTVSCNRFTTVSVDVVNSGLVEENVTVNVRNTALGINVNSDAKVVTDTETFTIQLNVSLFKTAGTYTLDITADSEDVSASSSIDWTIGACDVTYSPIENPTITEDVNQLFGITLPTDFSAGTIRWYLDGDVQETFNDLTEFTYTAENNDGITQHNVDVEVSDNYDYTESHSWILKASSRPITTGFDGETTTFTGMNDTNLSNVVNATFEISQYGKVVFSEALDLRNVVDLAGSVKIEDGIIAIDSNRYSQFDNVPATITLYGVDYDETPRVFFNGGFTIDGTEITTECAFCEIISYTPAPTSNGEVVFTVEHFSSFRVGDVEDPVNPPVDNTAPRITSSPSERITVNEAYSYQVQAVDDEGDTISYDLTTKPEGMTISNTGLVSWTPNATGDYTVVVKAIADNQETTQSYTITVAEENYLIIDKLEITINDDKDKDYDNGDKIKNVEPGSILEFAITVKNVYNNKTDIEDIEFTVTIEDVDGSDIDDSETSTDSISRNKKVTETITLELPYQIDEDETYKVIIEVDGEDEYGHNQGEVWELEFEVDKDSRKVVITEARLSPNLVTCQRSANLDVEIINIGEKEEDVTLTVKSFELGIDEEVEVTLDEQWDDDDNDYSKFFYFTVDDDVKAGDYDIEVEAKFSRGSDSIRVPLMVSDCTSSRVGQSDDDIVELQTLTLTQAPITATTSQKTQNISFRDTSTYYTLLAVALIVVLGLLVFMIGAVIITAKKK
jgi:PKD repeat protein